MLRLFPASFIAPCQPMSVPVLPVGDHWLHELKHDGFRLMVRWDGDRVRLFHSQRHDWAARYPAIIRAAAEVQARSFLINGEVVVAHAGRSLVRFAPWPGAPATRIPVGVRPA